MRSYSVAWRLLGIVLTSPVLAQQTTTVAGLYSFNIPAEPLGQALTELAQQTGLQVMIFSKLVDGMQSPELRGSFSANDALKKLLANTRLQFKFVNSRTVAIEPDAHLPPGPSRPGADTPRSDDMKEPASGAVKSRDSTLNEEKKMNNRNLFARLLGLFAVCGTAMDTGTACAQTAGSTAQSGTLEEIIVTAERREENLQKTPLAITALTGETLDARGISSPTALNQLVPGLSVANTGKSAQIGIRGIVSTNDNEIGDPAVAFNVDGVYLARSRAATSALFDVQRIEVLRGPQGTLYGRNATAGSINVITNKPDLSKDAMSGWIQVGNYNALQAFGMINLAVNRSFGLRASVQTDRHDGYSNNWPAQPYQDLDSAAARVQALWQPSDRLTATLSFDYYHNGGAGDGAYGAVNQLGTYATGSGATPYAFQVPYNGYNNETTQGTTLLIDWSLPIATLSYVGNYRTDKWHNFSGQSVDGAGCVSVTDTKCQINVYRSYESQTSHELRLANSTDRLKWVAGLYFFDEHNDTFLGFYPAFGNATFARVLLAPIVKAQSQAAFGQTTFSITDRLRLTGGLRYTKDRKFRIGGTYTGGKLVGEQCLGCNNQTVNSYADLSWSKTNWKAGLEFDVSADSMLYASVGTGYKAGGYSDGLPPNNHPYNPENILAYELGIKNELLDHRLQVNVDLFDDLYKDYQASGLAPVAGGGTALITLNAGKATIYGAEVETQALITDIDKLNLSVAFLHARFTNFDLPNGDSFSVPANAPISYTGNRLPHAPSFTVNAGYQHNFALLSGASVIPRIDFTYVTAQDLDYHNFVVTKQGAYTRTDLSLSYEPMDRRWRATAYVHNAENKAVLTNALPDPRAATIPLGMTSGTGTYLPPRTFGVKLAAKF